MRPRVVRLLDRESAQPNRRCLHWAVYVCSTVQPSVAKTCASKAVYDIAATPNNLPNKLRVIVFIHQKNRTLIQAEGPWRRPAALVGDAARIAWIETGNESIRIAPFRFKNFDNVADRFYYDLRREREKRGYRPFLSPWLTPACALRRGIFYTSGRFHRGMVHF